MPDTCYVGTVYAIKNNTNGKYIGKDKLMLWNQTQDLTHAYLGHNEAAANMNCKRLNNVVKKYRDEYNDPFNTGYKNPAYINDVFVVIPVELHLS